MQCQRNNRTTQCRLRVVLLKAMPTIRPLRTAKDAGVRQPKPPFRSLPANSLHIGPSGSSKTYTLIATLTQKDMLGGMFDRYELYAANIHQDPQYQVLIDYVEKRQVKSGKIFAIRLSTRMQFGNSWRTSEKRTRTYVRLVPSAWFLVASWWTTSVKTLRLCAKVIVF